MMKNLLTLLLLITTLNLIAQTNIVPNGDMENWDSFGTSPDNWFIFLDGFWERSFDFQNGTSSLELEIASDRTFIYIKTSDLQFANTTTYVCTFYYKVVSGIFTNVEFNLVHTPNTSPENLVVNEFTDLSTTQWKKGEFEFTSSATENVQAFIYARGNAGSKILFDNISIFDKSTLSISDFTEEINKVIVYPNPSKNFIRVTGVESLEHYIIYDVFGKEINKGETSQNKEINISNLASGMYFLRTEKGKASKFFKE